MKRDITHLYKDLSILDGNRRSEIESEYETWISLEKVTQVGDKTGIFRFRVRTAIPSIQHPSTKLAENTATHNVVVVADDIASLNHQQRLGVLRQAFHQFQRKSCSQFVALSKFLNIWIPF